MMAFSDMTPEVKEQFYYAGQKGGWTSEEAFEHLVPDILKDNPEEVLTFMNGGTVEREVWVYDRGRAGGHYETIEFEISDKDISRIVSGKNGGEYSPDNTIMEDMSINRSRGATNMNPEEYQTALETNARDAIIIDENPTQDVIMFEEQIITEVASESLLDVAVDAAFEGILPIGTAVAAAAAVGSKFEKKEERLGYGALAAGGGALFAMTPIGQVCILGYAGYRLFKAGKKVYDKLEEEPVIG
tara:strand:- start:160 stop:891 length:732 start_codon:yes stop_codon:yes gene_type:complete